MKKTIKNKIIDILLIVLTVLPLTCCLILKSLFSVPGEGISVSGPQIYATVKMPLQDLYISESTVVSFAVVLTVLFIVLFLTRNLKIDHISKRQMICEFLIEKCDYFVTSNMGKRFAGFSPFIGAIMILSALSSLTSLLGLFPPTSDLNVVAGWAIMSFALITHYKLKGGFWYYLKGFTEPIPIFTPFNFISELATPVSMAFRHYGNVLSGVVVSTLVSAGLAGLSDIIFTKLPGVLSGLKIFRIGLPAVLSLYFDIFSGCLQAFIFAILTMLYVLNGFPEDKYNERQLKKRNKKKSIEEV